MNFVDNIIDEIIDQYMFADSSNRPWIIGFSGGKDSTVMLQLVWKALEKAKHRAMLEHAYVFFRLDEVSMRNFLVQLDAKDYKYFNIADNYVSGSFRTFLDLGDIYVSIADEFNNFVLLEMLKQLGMVYSDIFEYNLDFYDFRPSAGEVELISL